jgi:CubicO group peptidase (beta-lactamase class C family)
VRRRRDWRLALTIPLMLVAGGCTAYRILRHRNPDPGDTALFASRTVAAAANPWVLPARPLPLGEEFRVTFSEKWKGPWGVASGSTLEDVLTHAPVQAFVVLHDGRLVYERYARGGAVNAPHASMSLVKPIVGALVGIAIQEGFLSSVEQPVQPLIPDLTGRKFADLRVKHLLEMTSGLNCSDHPRNPLTGINALYYTKNLTGRVRKFSADHAPGSHFEYRSADTLLLGLLVERATGIPLSHYLERRIWGPAGMETSATWSMDSARHNREKAFCCLQATARDLARFGQLYLDDGRRQDRAVVPSAWVHDSTVARVPETPRPYFGWQWWVGDGDFWMDGIQGQYLYVNRRHRVVIVMFSEAYSRIDEEVLAALAAFLGSYRP